jgi:hypothetical protein
MLGCLFRMIAVVTCLILSVPKRVQVAAAIELAVCDPTEKGLHEALSEEFLAVHPGPVNVVAYSEWT